jgi:hypothetical protein
MKAFGRALGAGGVLVVALALLPSSFAAERAKEACDAKTVSSYVDAQKGDVKATCFDPRKNQRDVPAEVKMTAHLTYDEKGNVDNVSIVKGFHPLFGSCVVGKLRLWHPPCGPDKLDVDFVWRK